MSELSIRVRKQQDNGSSFRATPDNLYLGGVRSAKVDKLKFELPEEWAACAVTLHVQRLSGTLPDPQALDAENCVEVDRRWTLEKQGTWMLLAVGEGGYIAMTKPAQYTCYETIDTDSTTETIDPSVYEQFVDLVLKSVNEAKNAAKQTEEDRAAADQILTDTKQAGTDAVAAVNTAKTTALQDVETARTGALTDIGNARSGAMTDIGNAWSGAMTDIGNAWSGAVQDVTDTKSAALTALEEKRAAAMQEMQGSVDAAAGSAEKAAASEGNAKGSALSAKASKEAAAKSEAAAKKAEEEATKQAAIAGTRAGTDKTLSIPDAPADAKQVGDALAGMYTKEEIQKLIEDSLAAYRAEEYAKIRYWVSDDPTSPASFIGGTWEQIKDSFILAAGDTYAAGSTGGAKTVTLTRENLPNYALSKACLSAVNDCYGAKIEQLKWGTTGAWHGDMMLGGSSRAFSILPPYLALYVWRRVA